MIKRIFVFLSISLFLTLVCAVDVLACTCRDDRFRPIVFDYEEADAVFTAEIVEVKEVPDSEQEGLWPADLLVKYKLLKRFKGISESTRSLTLEADYGASSCGFAVDRKPKPAVGQKWIVFANQTRNGSQLRLTNTCGKSRVLTSESEISRFHAELSDLDTSPGIVFAFVDDDRLIRPESVIVDGSGLVRNAIVDKTGLYQVRGLKAGKYTVSITFPYSAVPVNLFESLEITGDTKTDKATGKVQTILTYQVELSADSIRYHQIGIFKNP